MGVRLRNGSSSESGPRGDDRTGEFGGSAAGCGRGCFDVPDLGGGSRGMPDMSRYQAGERLSAGIEHHDWSEEEI